MNGPENEKSKFDPGDWRAVYGVIFVITSALAAVIYDKSQEIEKRTQDRFTGARGDVLEEKQQRLETKFITLQKEHRDNVATAMLAISVVRDYVEETQEEINKISERGPKDIRELLKSNRALFISYANDNRAILTRIDKMLSAYAQNEKAIRRQHDVLEELGRANLHEAREHCRDEHRGTHKGNQK